MKLIARNHLVETSGLNMTGEYVGSTKKKVEGELEKAKGGILFIDEAYELGRGQFGGEACSALVAAMTNPKYAGVVVIIAGYPGEISDMLDTNPGMKSRFQHFIEFPDWTPNDCVDFFTKRVAEKGFEMKDDAKSIVQDGFAQLVKMSGWGNARDVDDVWKAGMRERASRVVDLPSDSAQIRSLIAADIGPAIDEKVKAREMGSASVPSRPPTWTEGASVPSLPLDTQFSPHLHQRDKDVPLTEEAEAARAQPAPVELESTVQLENQASQEAIVDYSCSGCGSLNGGEGMMEEARDEGVPDNIWAELQIAKEEEYQREAARQMELQRLEEERKRIEAEHAAEQERLQQIAEEQARQEALRRAREAYEAQLRQQREAEERRRDEERKKQAIQEALRRISPCPAGFQWYQCGTGWRCGGGSHFVSDAELNRNFTQ